MKPMAIRRGIPGWKLVAMIASGVILTTLAVFLGYGPDFPIYMLCAVGSFSFIVAVLIRPDMWRDWGAFVFFAVLVLGIFWILIQARFTPQL